MAGLAPDPTPATRKQKQDNRSSGKIQASFFVICTGNGNRCILSVNKKRRLQVLKTPTGG